MNILVLGNGFDLALGLPTRYTDFLAFVRDVRGIFSSNLIMRSPGERGHNEFFGKLLHSDFHRKTRKKVFAKYPAIRNVWRAFHTTDLDVASVLDDFRFCVNRNLWIEYFLQQYDNKQMMGENWIDLEHEVKEVIRRLPSIDAISRAVDGETLETTTISKILAMAQEPSKIGLAKYRAIKKLLRENYERFVMALEIYLDFFVRKSKKEITVKKGKKQSFFRLPSILQGIKFNAALSFNYTDFFTAIPPLDNPPVETHFVHGKLIYCDGKRAGRALDEMMKESNIVLGFDEYLDNGKKNTQLDFVYYRKYFQRIAKRTGSRYLNWMGPVQTTAHMDAKERIAMETHLRQSPLHNVHIFGHSMDPTDKEVFKDILLREPNDTKVTIYYHDEDAHEHIITNLIAIIGQDRLIEKTYARTNAGAEIEIVPQ